MLVLLLQFVLHHPLICKRSCKTRCCCSSLLATHQVHLAATLWQAESSKQQCITHHTVQSQYTHEHTSMAEEHLNYVYKFASQTAADTMRTMHTHYTRLLLCNMLYTYFPGLPGPQLPRACSRLPAQQRAAQTPVRLVGTCRVHGPMHGCIHSRRATRSDHSLLSPATLTCNTAVVTLSQRITARICHTNAVRLRNEAAGRAEHVPQLQAVVHIASSSTPGDPLLTTAPQIIQ